MIRQFPIHFFSSVFFAVAIIVTVCYPSFEFVLHLKNNTIEGLKGITDAYKSRYGELSETDAKGQSSSHPTFDGLFEIPAGQSYVDVVASLDFKPKGAIGTMLDSEEIITVTIDGRTLANATTSGIRFYFSAVPSKGARLAVHIF
jgi:hypothetical protein